jgi:hypothetical protein
LKEDWNKLTSSLSDSLWMPWRKCLIVIHKECDMFTAIVCKTGNVQRSLQKDPHAFLCLYGQIFEWENNILNKRCKEQWNIYDQCIFSVILRPTVGELIKSDVMRTFSNF